jgi:iron complex outermembrane receptor protein
LRYETTQGKRSIGRLRAALLIGASAAAFAQALPAAAQTTAQVDEIVVTAQRRAEKLQDVPATVAVVTADSLQQSGVSRFQDLGRAVPGVMIGQLGVVTQPSIRGVTSVASTIGGENNVGVYIDGFYQADQYAVNQDFANLENVQVLKGPQGTLYGRNATAGAIIITTLDPGDAFSGNVKASYGERNDTRLQGAVSVPIVAGKLSLGIAGYYRTDDGYIKDINGFGPDRKRNAAPFMNRSIRTKLKFTPNDNVSVVLGYNDFYIDDPRGVAHQVWEYPAQNVRNILAGTEPTTVGLQQAIRQRDVTSLSFRPHTVAEGEEYTALIRIMTGDFGELTSHTAYQTKRDRQFIDFDGSPRNSVILNIQNRRKTFTQAIDYTFTGVSNLTLLAGAFYLQDIPWGGTVTSGLFTGTQPVPLAVSKTYLKTPYSFAGYVDGTYGLSDRLFLTVGGRYTVERKSAMLLNAAVVATPGPAFGTIGPFVDQRGPGQPIKKTFESFTPRVVLRYNLAPDTNVYASLSKGFKSGTFNVGAAPLNPVQPEKITGYEVGFKTRQGSLRAEISGFYYDYKNLQLSKVFIDQNNILRTGTNNAANSQVYGVDASVSQQFGERLKVYAGVEYLHARYKDYADATSFDVRVAANGDLFIANNTAANPQDWSDLQMIRSPTFSGNVGATYDAPLFGGSLLLATNFNFTTKYAPRDDSTLRYVCTGPGVPAVGTAYAGGSVAAACLVAGQTINDTGKRRFLQDGYVLGNVSADWTDGSGRYTVGVFVNNVTNTRYKIFYSAATTIGDVAVYNEPRQFGVRAGVKF